ncbi:MAG: N-formylglutamate amidohydrolase [Pseudomonadota bacterium]
MIDGQPFRQVGQVRPGGIVCVADHASNFVPEDVPLGVPRSLLDTHIAVDIGVNGVAARMARQHDMPAHLATVSRLVIDLHREEDHPHVVPTESDGHLIPGNIGANVEARLDRFHRPYHAALEQWLDAAQPELIVSLHSFTPKLESNPDNRPWEVALLYNEDDRAARQAIRLFSELGLNVGDNEPYSGRELNATMNRHAEAKGRYYCAIEIRQDLIANRADQSRWAAMVADVAGRVALALN